MSTPGTCSSRKTGRNHHSGRAAAYGTLASAGGPKGACNQTAKNSTIVSTSTQTAKSLAAWFGHHRWSRVRTIRSTATSPTAYPCLSASRSRAHPSNTNSTGSTPACRAKNRVSVWWLNVGPPRATSSIWSPTTGVLPTISVATCVAV